MVNALQATFAKIIGAILLIIGLLGFAWNPLFSVFSVNVWHNIIHVVLGAIGLIAGFAATGKYAKPYNIVIGLGFLIVAVLGFSDASKVVELLNLNIPDNVAHLVIAILGLGIGFGAKD